METRSTVVTKMRAYVAESFGGDWQKAFSAYAQDGKINESTLELIFARAGVGYALSRSFIADMAIQVFDANGDKCIDWSEFQNLARVTQQF